MQSVLATHTDVAKAYNSVPQLQRRFCVTDRAGVPPIGRRLILCPHDFDLGLRPYSHNAICSPDLPFNGLYLRNLCNYMDYYFSAPEMTYIVSSGALNSTY